MSPTVHQRNDWIGPLRKKMKLYYVPGGIVDKDQYLAAMNVCGQGCKLFALEASLWLKNLSPDDIASLVAQGGPRPFRKDRVRNPRGLTAAEELLYSEMSRENFFQRTRANDVGLLCCPQDVARADKASAMEVFLLRQKNGTFVLECAGEGSHCVAGRKEGRVCLVVDSGFAFEDCLVEETALYLPISVLPEAYIELSMSRRVIERYAELCPAARLQEQIELLDQIYSDPNIENRVRPIFSILQRQIEKPK